MFKNVHVSVWYMGNIEQTVKTLATFLAEQLYAKEFLFEPF